MSMHHRANTKVKNPPVDKPLMVYDGDCAFCRRWIGRWGQITESSVDYAPFQEISHRFPEIPHEAFKRAVQLIEPNGSVSEGAEAVFRALAYTPRRRWMLWAYEHFPGIARVSEWFYGVIARHRDAGFALTQLLWGAHLERPAFSLSTGLFLRLLGFIYLIAFVSIGTQIHGLIGSNGILPLDQYLEVLSSVFGAERFRLFPTLSWLNRQDGFLDFLCGGGVVLSLLVIFGILQAPCLFVLWAFYLSVTVDCREFLAFQWDVLLLETGFLAIFLAPLKIKSGLARATSPPRIALWLFRWLLFRLMFSSGAVKLASGDLSWRNLTAFQYHYETQPLPTWLGWYAHQLPAWFQTGSVAVLFLIELLVPLLIFAPRRLRIVAAVTLAIFQTLVAATGNYGFFNLLSIALCILLVDDATWPHRWREKLSPADGSTGEARNWPRWLLGSIAATVVAITFVLTLEAMRLRLPYAGPSIEAVDEYLAPFHTINRYGLFAVMTTSRAEIIIQGSDTGDTWRDYEFKWKPGDVRRRPGFVAPHQPRLDWQMWFAALGNYPENPWFLRFIEGLLRRSPEVIALLERNPFPEGPPRYIRALLYEYHFTDLGQLRSTGAWWRREFKSIYFPAHSLTR